MAMLGALLAGWLLICSLSSTTLAARLLKSANVPEGLTNGCATALAADVANCSPAIAQFQRGTYYGKTELQTLCTAGCASSLAAYHGAVLSACAADTWTGLGSGREPVGMISELIRYNYNLTCLADGARFCNNAAAAFAAHLDPEAAAQPGGMPAGGDYGPPVLDPCDACLVALLRFQAGSPYYNGLDLQSASAYQSKTASCGITGAPLTTTTLSIFQ